MILSSIVVYQCIILSVLAAPSLNSAHIPRDSAANSPSINATTIVHDHSGLDISSSFKVKVYHQPSTKAGTDKVGNELNNRQTQGTQFAQLVNACPADETFVNSHCDPEAGGENAMQKYVYTCKRMEDVHSTITGNVIGTRPIFRIRDGHCQPMEICVTNFKPRLVATCIQHWVFDDYTIDKDGILRPMLGGVVFNLDGLNMHAALSESDGSTSVEAHKLDVQALAGNEVVQQRSCTGCAEVGMPAFGPKTDSLKVEATLMSAGAMAGILWLGFMSG